MRRVLWSPERVFGWSRREVPEWDAVIYEARCTDQPPVAQASQRTGRGRTWALATLLVASGSVLVTFLVALLVKAL